EAQVLDVVAVDLGELRVPLRRVVAVHHQPVLRLVLGIEQPLLGDRDLVLGRGGGRRQRQPPGGPPGKTHGAPNNPLIMQHFSSLRLCSTLLLSPASAKSSRDNLALKGGYRGFCRSEVRGRKSAGAIRPVICHLSSVLCPLSSVVGPLIA